MRGYLSFVLAFLSLALILSLLSLSNAAGSRSLSKAVSVERIYGVEMNVKEIILEEARQGGRTGFSIYSTTHFERMCKHCPDNFCAPYIPPAPPPENACDETLCSACFREDEARNASEYWSELGISSLNGHMFDPDFSINIGHADTEASLSADPLRKGYFILSDIRFREDLRINISSEKLSISAGSRIPAGTGVDCG